MRKQAFATFVYGGYHKFLPFYTFCINKNYPEATILVFYLGVLPTKVLALLSANKTVVLYDDFKMEDTWLQQYKHRGAVKQSLRHLLPGSYFEAFDEVYMGDVDILILNEPENLFSFHRKQAKKHSLPFSNKVRLLPDGTPSKRLTGLQYIITKPYYKAMQPIIDAVQTDIDFRDAIFSKSQRNEEVLYYLNEKAFGFDAVALTKNERPWHGFHLGLVRGKDYLNQQTVLENSSIDMAAIKSQLSAMYKDVTFEEMMLEYFCPELYYTLLFLEINVSKKVHSSYNMQFQKQKIKNVVSKIKKKLKRL